MAPILAPAKNPTGPPTIVPTKAPLAADPNALYFKATFKFDEPDSKFS